MLGTEGIVCVLFALAVIVAPYLMLFARSRARRCPRCRELLESANCENCQWPAPSREPPETVALRSLTTQLVHFVKSGMLSRAAADRIRQALDAEAAQITRPSPLPRPTPREAIEFVPVAGKDAPASPAMPAAPPAPPPVDQQSDWVIPVEDEREVAPAAFVAAPVAAGAPPPAPSGAHTRDIIGRMGQAAPREPSAEPEKKAHLAALLATFMEERNVRWGELVGGLLIVGCSIALVISFWAQIAARPLLKFGLFNGIVAALYGLGFYAANKWKLPTTSRGVLVIATLLVPLNFLSIAAVTRNEAADNPLVIVGEVVSAIIFSLLVYQAGRTITAPAPMALTAGVLGSSIAQLIVRRWTHGDISPALLYTLAGLPLASYGGAVAVMLARLRRLTSWGEADVGALLRLLGLTVFAAIPPCAMLVNFTGDIHGTLVRLAPLVALAGAPALVCGALLWRRLRDTELTSLRTAGTAIAILAAGIMLGGAALAWPQPNLLVSVAAVDFVVLLLIAITCDLPAAHLAAGAVLTLGYLTTFQVGWGALQWSDNSPSAVLHALLSATSGNALLVLAIGYAAVAAACYFTARRLHALWCAAVAAGVALLSLALVTIHGFRVVGDPYQVMWVYGVYTLVAFAVARAFSPANPDTDESLEYVSTAAAWVGSLLDALCIVQAIVYRPVPPAGFAGPLTLAAIVHSGTTLAVAGFSFRPRTAYCAVRSALEQSALLTSFIAAYLIASEAFGWFDMPVVAATVSAEHAALLTVVWLAAAVICLSSLLFTFGQAMMFVSATFVAIVLASRQEWFATSPYVELDPRMLQILGLAWAPICLAWLGIRIGANRFFTRPQPAETESGPQAQQPAEKSQRSLVEQFFRPLWPAIDHLATGALVMMLAGLAVYAALPGVAQELSPRKTVLELQAEAPELVTQVSERRLVPATAAFEPWGLPHNAAAAIGTWGLLGLLILLLVAGFWDAADRWRVLGVLVVAAAVCPLLAARWEPQVAVASALRWLSAGYFGVGSIAFWSRERLSQWGRKLGCRIAAGQSANLPAESIGLLGMLAVAPLLAMGGYVASAALRHAQFEPWLGQAVWPLGCFGLIALVVGLFLSSLVRQQSAQQSARPAWTAAAQPAGTLLLVVGVAPLVVVSCYCVAAALVGNPVVGPDPAAIFVRMGLAANYSLPAALVSLVLLGYAIRERSAPFAFVAGMVTNLSATLAYLFTIGGRLAASDPSLWTDLGQLNALVAALCGLAWYAAIRWHARKVAKAEPPIDPLQYVQATFALALHLLVLISACIALFNSPIGPPAWLPRVAGPLGVAAALTALLLSYLLCRGRGATFLFPLAATSLWSAGALAGAAAVRWDNLDDFAMHVLLAARIVAPWMLIAAAWYWSRGRQIPIDDPRRRAAAIWATLLAVPVLVIGLRMVGARDPQEPWWSTAAVISIGLLAATLAIWSARRRSLYVAAVMFVAAAALWYPRSAGWASLTSDESTFALIHALVLALAAPIVAWLVIELRILRRQEDPLERRRALAVHRPATWLSLLILMLVTSAGVLADFSGHPLATTSLLGYAALAALGAACFSCLWDERAREAEFVLYVFGLLLVGKYLDALDLAGDRLLWSGVIALGAFNLAAAYLWSRRDAVRALVQRLGIPWHRAEEGDSAAWIVSMTSLLVAAVLVLVFWIELSCPDQTMRLTAGQGAIAQGIALGLLAAGKLRARLQASALFTAAVGAVAVAWSWIAPDAVHPLLDRSVATCVALIVVAIVYILGFARLPARLGDWPAAAQRFAPVVVVALAMSIVGVLVQEVLFYNDDGAVPLSSTGIAAVVAALLSLFAAMLAAALLPGRDPLGLGERGRMAYVYAAESVLAVLFLHVRLTLPWLFSGRCLAYWPLIVMGIAYLGVGLAEWFGRRRQRILSEPLERTGIILPLLPVLGFWFVPSQTNYTMLMLVVSALYAALAVTRKSAGFGLLAALAANGGLWHYLHQLDGLGLFEHPQLWLIPPALCVLAAAYLNRDRLTTAQMTGVRYITSMTIYLSSTADIFINGVAAAPWLPLVLGAISLAGIFAGIALRVRAFLFLGTSFLVLSIVTIIWHAAVDLEQTWIWYVSGIVVGVGIVVLFAIFEKKRHDVIELAAKLKQWDA